MTRIGIIGAGHIGGNIARFLTQSGHDVVVSFSQDPAKLGALAAATGARAATPAEAAAYGEIVVVSVPWGVVDAALEQAGGADALAGKTVLDTTNQFGQVGGRFGVLGLDGRSAAETNAAKAPRAAWVKALTPSRPASRRPRPGAPGPDEW